MKREYTLSKVLTDNWIALLSVSKDKQDDIALKDFHVDLILIILLLHSKNVSNWEVADEIRQQTRELHS